MKCTYCADTGIIIPLNSISLETLIKIQNEKYMMECDYCETIPNLKLYNKYIKVKYENRIQR